MQTISECQVATQANLGRVQLPIMRYLRLKAVQALPLAPGTPGVGLSAPALGREAMGPAARDAAARPAAAGREGPHEPANSIRSRSIELRALALRSSTAPSVAPKPTQDPSPSAMPSVAPTPTEDASPSAGPAADAMFAKGEALTSSGLLAELKTPTKLSKLPLDRLVTFASSASGWSVHPSSSLAKPQERRAPTARKEDLR